MKYNPQKLRESGKKFGRKRKIYRTKDLSKKPKFYCLDMFPYPSGAGLHVGAFERIHCNRCNLENEN